MRGAAGGGWTHLRVVDDVVPDDAHALWRRYAHLAKRAGVEFNFHCASIRDHDEAAVALEGATAVYHLDELADYRGGCFRAARIRRANVEGTASVLRCCARGARVVFVSSTAVSLLLCTVTYYANRAHNLTRSP
jgi:nucleoside-diphosphate-sugar epimerase